jgi:hypothetical protein
VRKSGYDEHAREAEIDIEVQFRRAIRNFFIVSNTLQVHAGARDLTATARQHLAISNLDPTCA